jgi:hypothetical protein
MRLAWREKGHIIIQMWKPTKMGNCLKLYMTYNIPHINATDWAAYNSWHVFQYFV